MKQFFPTIFRQANIGQSRSSVLNPLQWVLAVLLAGIPALGWAVAPEWMWTLLGALIGLVFLLIAVAYVYFMVTNPDMLRSEHYSLSKMALEKGLLGDDAIGLFSAVSSQETEVEKLLPSMSKDKAGQ